MRKTFRLFCAGAALTALCTVSALAAVADDCADKLHTLGLFEGTQAGYELEREPTRAEAAVMLVRLLGAEAKAKALTYTAPFTDLKGWEAPYIQYLYQNGLTSGTSETTFDPSGVCSAQMYATFLLRALGENVPYTEALYRACSLGIYDACVDTEVFQRGDAVTASYNALSIVPEGTDSTLLAQLTHSGAVGGTAAIETRTLFERYAEYQEDTAGMDALEHFTFSNSLLFPTEITIGERKLTLNTSETAEVNRSAETLHIEREITLTTGKAKESSTKSSVRLESGALSRTTGIYQQTKDLSSKARQELLSLYGRVPLAYITGIERDGNEGGWVITCKEVPATYRELIYALENTIGDMDSAAVSRVSVKHNTKDGKIVSQGVSLTFERDGASGELTFVSTMNQDET